MVYRKKIILIPSYRNDKKDWMISQWPIPIFWPAVSVKGWLIVDIKIRKGLIRTMKWHYPEGVIGSGKAGNLQ